MYSIIEIGGTEYKREFSIEASLYKDCTEKLMNFVSEVTAAQNISSGSAAQQAEATKAALSGMSDLPVLAMTLWYAGFMEHHGIDGDGKVSSMRDAKDLYRQYRLEHPDNSSFYDILSECMNQMQEDGFFDLIGLTQMTQAMDTAQTRRPKTPQDHKRKVTAKQ